MRRASCLLPVLLFCLTVRPLSALPAELALAVAPVMPPAHAPAHRPNPHHHHHHHLLAPGPSPLHAPAHAPAEHYHHHHHHNVHAPAPGPTMAHAPAKAPPSHVPVHPPSHAPTGPHMPRSFIAVQGVVYCKSCKYAGVETLLGATPLLGQCLIRS